MMASESEPLTPEEFASLLTVGNTCAVREPPAVIAAEHSARLIGLGYSRINKRAPAEFAELQFALV
jgi:hypothetical protein